MVGELELDVEKIIKERTFGRWKKKQYLVRWKGYSPSHDEWVSEEDLHAPDLLAEFKRQSSSIRTLSLDDTATCPLSPTIVHPLHPPTDFLTTSMATHTPPESTLRDENSTGARPLSRQESSPPPLYIPPPLLQSTDQFFLFPLFWTTQYTARSTTSSAYKYSTCTRTPYPAHIVPTTSPTCLQPIPHRPPSPIRCHRLLRATPRSCPATATSGKPAPPTSATFRRRDVQPHPCRQFHRPLWSPPAPLPKRRPYGRHSAFRPPPLQRHRASRLHVLRGNPPMALQHSRRSRSQGRRSLQRWLLRRLSPHTTTTRPRAASSSKTLPQQLEIQGGTPDQGLRVPSRWRKSQYS